MGVEPLIYPRGYTIVNAEYMWQCTRTTESIVATFMRWQEQ